MNKKNWAVDLAKELKKRDNKEIITSCIGTVINLSPLTVSIFGGEIVLKIDDNLKFSETFGKRINLDKDFGLSVDNIGDFATIETALQAIQTAITLLNTFMATNTASIATAQSTLVPLTVLTPCVQAIITACTANLSVTAGLANISNIIKDIVDNKNKSIAEKINTELLNLKCDLQLKDKVLIIPSIEQDIFHLVDKI